MRLVMLLAQSQQLPCLGVMEQLHATCSIDHVPRYVV